jgi:rod shape determining protein RodA
MNLQPSELMKIGLILFLAKYYHRISIESINSFRYLILPITVLIAPIILVATQPDLGTSILIAAGGVIVAWLAGSEQNFLLYQELQCLLYCQ